MLSGSGHTAGVGSLTGMGSLSNLSSGQHLNASLSNLSTGAHKAPRPDSSAIVRRTKFTPGSVG